MVVVVASVNRVWKRRRSTTHALRKAAQLLIFRQLEIIAEMLCKSTQTARGVIKITSVNIAVIFSPQSNDSFCSDSSWNMIK